MPSVPDKAAIDGDPDGTWEIRMEMFKANLRVNTAMTFERWLKAVK